MSTGSGGCEGKGLSWEGTEEKVQIMREWESGTGKTGFLLGNGGSRRSNCREECKGKGDQFWGCHFAMGEFNAKEVKLHA